MADNPVVPEDLAHQETAWELMQSQIGDGGNGKRQAETRRAGRRFACRGAALRILQIRRRGDPVTGQAICADGLCNAPADSEIGDFIGAQNGAVNLNVPAQYSVTVTVDGDGSVSSSDRVIALPRRMHDDGAAACDGYLDGESGQGSIFGLDRRRAPARAWSARSRWTPTRPPPPRS